jgi:hypothetical protein
MTMRFLLSLTALAVFTTAALAQTSQSTSAARNLVQRLEARHIDTIAVADPQTPGRFIAALYVAPSQLLVVGARHPNTDALAAAIREKRYRDVYLDLQGTPTVDDKLFVHDIGADGLAQSGQSVIDNAYQGGVRTELAKAGKASGRLAVIDAEYARMLGVLAGALDSAPEPSLPPPAGVQTGLATR